MSQAESLLELLVQPVAILDTTGKLMAWNSRFVGYCGRPPSPNSSLADVLGSPRHLSLAEGCVEIDGRKLLCLSASGWADGATWIVFIHDERADSAWRKRLSARVRSVVDLISMGLTNKEIAAELGIAESTVKKHVSSALRIARVSHRSQLW